MSEPGDTPPRPPRRDPAAHGPVAAALHALVDAAAIDRALDPTDVHRALGDVLLRVVLLRALGEPLPPAAPWRALQARSRERFAAHAIPLLAPDRHPLLAAIDLPDPALALADRHVAALTLGDVHQALLELRLERGPDDHLHLRPADERRRRGGHYTAPALARSLIARALGPRLRELGDPPDPEALLELRVCDPAMGCAAFLIHACDLLAGHLARARRDQGLARARRDVALACLHGVDLDPRAVELARLSLWLHLGEPALALTSLHKNLRHGDALVGLTLAQINAADWRPDPAPAPAPPDPRLVGDALIATFFAATRPAERERARLRISTHPGELPPSLATLHTRTPPTYPPTSPPTYPPIYPLHWPLEYPHIFTRDNPGFDLIIGNPPYFWGNRIGRAFGPAYRDWLQTLHPGAHGNSDLAAHFLRRGFALLRDGGALGFITTNSISEAETRLTGLAHLQAHGGTIYHADRDLAWPGDASVRVAAVCVRRGPVPGPHTLDGRELPAITSDLRPGLPTAAPRRLPARRGQSFKGVDFGGTGFLLTADARAELLARAPAEARFVWPALNAIQLVSGHPLAPAHHIINFSGHDLADLTDLAPHCLDIVRRAVLPRRLVDRRRHRRERWWLYNEACPGLYRAIAGLPRVLVGPVVARHVVFEFADPHTVFTNALNVFAFADAAALALLQARPHQLWALSHASSLRCDPRYNPTTCFETYPFPPAWPELPRLRALGEQYHQHRRDLMQRRGEGLTAAYNRFHDPHEAAADIHELRRLHAELDHAALAAHGWHDLLPHAHAAFQPGPGDPPRVRLSWPAALVDEVHARLRAANSAA